MVPMAIDGFLHDKPLDDAADGSSHFYEYTTAMIKEKDFRGTKTL